MLTGTVTPERPELTSSIIPCSVQARLASCAPQRVSAITCSRYAFATLVGRQHGGTLRFWNRHRRGRRRRHKHEPCEPRRPTGCNDLIDLPAHGVTDQHVAVQPQLFGDGLYVIGHCAKVVPPVRNELAAPSALIDRYAPRFSVIELLLPALSAAAWTTAR